MIYDKTKFKTAETKFKMKKFKSDKCKFRVLKHLNSQNSVADLIYE